MNLEPQMSTESEEQVASRKQDHISLAFESQVHSNAIAERFFYEPMITGHPSGTDLSVEFLGKSLKVPIWVSSMTGGTERAKQINQNLAKACGEFGMGMGLGSCRSLLFDDTRLSDFDVRSFIGDSYPLYANLGIAQIEQLLATKQLDRIIRLLEKLQSDGLIIHVNPTQEYLQPEGDLILRPPISVIEELLSKAEYPIIVKEVGQGMGYHSLKALLQLPLEAIELASLGGTNFALLELLRSDPIQKEAFQPLSKIGHHAEEMVDWINILKLELKDRMQCRQIIISGGIKNFLDGYFLREKLTLPSLYGQASTFLKYALQDYDILKKYVELQIKGLAYAKTFLKIRGK